LKMCEDGGLLLKSGIKIWEEGSFTGKELDESGLLYFGARYYDPLMGTWLSPDPAMEGVNWYTYCRNNPVKYIDIWGLNPSITWSQAYASAQGNPGFSPISTVEADPGGNNNNTNGQYAPGTDATKSAGDPTNEGKGEGKIKGSEDDLPQGDQEEKENVTEKDKGKKDDPYTTGPSERGVSTTERVNYVEAKRQIEEKEKNDDGRIIEPLLSQKEDRPDFEDFCLIWALVNEVLDTKAKVKDENSRDDVKNNLKDNAKYSSDNTRDIINKVLLDKKVNTKKLNAQETKDLINKGLEINDRQRLVVKFTQKAYWDNGLTDAFHFVGYRGRNNNFCITYDSYYSTLYDDRGTVDDILCGVSISIDDK